MATYFTSCPHCGTVDDCTILKTKVYADLMDAWNDTFQLSCPNCYQQFTLTPEERNSVD